MARTFRPALVLLGLFTILTGLVYPAVVTGAASLLFPRQAKGSLIVGKDGTVLGSTLIGQPFDEPRYLWGRPSGTTPAYNAGASSGTNYGPLHPGLAAMVRARVEALRKVDPGNAAPIPVDLVTASGSGLDPHVSRAAAEYQVARIARARGVDAATVRAIVAAHTERPTLGILGDARVNVLAVNLALDGAR